MADAKERLFPGTATTQSERGEKGFSKIDMLLEATGGLSLSQVCAVTGLEGSTIQNWVKRGWVAHPKGKRYEEKHIARILIINALKECIKLENIVLLISYVNGTAEGGGSGIIKESELYNYLCEALKRMGRAELSHGGVDSVADAVIKDYIGPRVDSRGKVRRALSLMIYACVCTDVKRRTETMMEQILNELEHPVTIEPLVVEMPAPVVEEEPVVEVEDPGAPRKTVSQALREWDTNDISSVERVIIDYNGDDSAKTAPQNEEKHSFRPWYTRKGTKH